MGKTGRRQSAACLLYTSRLEYYRNKNKVNDDFVFCSETMMDLIDDAFEVASSDVFILIEGESGTGKAVSYTHIGRHRRRIR